MQPHCPCISIFGREAVVRAPWRGPAPGTCRLADGGNGWLRFPVVPRDGVAGVPGRRYRLVVHAGLDGASPHKPFPPSAAVVPMWHLFAGEKGATDAGGRTAGPGRPYDQGVGRISVSLSR